MKNSTAMILFFIVMCLSAYLIAQAIITVRQERIRNNYNALCSTITDELNSNIDENSTCIENYCYYKPYAPPEGELKNATNSLCACDCKMKNGTVITIQILTPK